MSELTVTVSGPVGSGKSALVGEIEILMRALGVPVRYANPAHESFEKNVRGADWQSDLELYKPTVVLAERVEMPSAVPPLFKFDPKDGIAEVYPSEARQYREYHGLVAWLFNPFTGERRTAHDVGSDPFGLLIVAPAAGKGGA